MSKEYTTEGMEYHIDDLETATNYQVKVVATYPDLSIDADQGRDWEI